MADLFKFLKGDGKYCVGCKHLTKIIKQFCLKGHVTIPILGCECCGIFQRIDIILGKIPRCEDYEKDDEFLKQQEEIMNCGKREEN